MEERRTPLVVVDCSVIIAEILDDEYDPLTEAVFDAFEDSQIVIAVPTHFLLETINVLLMQVRRKRISLQTYEEERKKLLFMPFKVDDGLIYPAIIADVSAIAEEHGLTTYDAAYLELARRKHAPLATLDNALCLAAKKAKLALFK